MDRGGTITRGSNMSGAGAATGSESGQTPSDMNYHRPTPANTNHGTHHLTASWTSAYPNYSSRQHGQSYDANDFSREQASGQYESSIRSATPSQGSELPTFTYGTKEAFLAHVEQHSSKVRRSTVDTLEDIAWLTGSSPRCETQKQFSRYHYVRKTLRYDAANDVLVTRPTADNGMSRIVVPIEQIPHVVDYMHTKLSHARWDIIWDAVKASHSGILRADVKFLIERCIRCSNDPRKRPTRESNDSCTESFEYKPANPSQTYASYDADGTARSTSEDHSAWNYSASDYEQSAYQQPGYQETGSGPFSYTQWRNPTEDSQVDNEQPSHLATVYRHEPSVKRQASYGQAQEFVACFGNLLLAKADAIAWVGYAAASCSSEHFDTTLQRLLKDYALELLSDSSTTQESDRELLSAVAKLIRRYRPSIARYFCLNAITRTTCTESQLHKETSEPPPPETSSFSDLKVRYKTSDEIPVDRFMVAPESDEDDDGLIQQVLVDLEKTHPLLESRRSFDRLMVHMRRTFYFDERIKMSEIKRVVIGAVHSSGPPKYCPTCKREVRLNPYHTTVESCTNHVAAWYHAEFELDWEPLLFMTSQYGPQFLNIGSVITLSGSALYAYATTVAKYVQEFWPRIGLPFLDCLSKELDKWKLGKLTEGDRDAHSNVDSGMHLRFEIKEENHLHATMYGTAAGIVGLAQLLSWLSAALNVSPRNNVGYCKTDLCVVASEHRLSDGPIVFTMKTEFEDLSPTENPCWLPLFSNAVIAHHFLIPERDQELGLEIPMDLMAALSGARHAVEYQGSVVLKGYSIMLAPVQKIDDRVQWHLVSSTGESGPLSYQEGISLFPSRAGLEQITLDALPHSRAIIGWCRTAATSLGRPDRQCYWNLDYSQAEDAQVCLNLAGGSMGFQQFGLAQLDFTLGPKESKCHYQRSGPFRSIVSASEKTPVVLYDSADRRAWLVPASDVMLHIAQHRCCLETFTVNGKPIQIQLGKSAKETLLSNASLSLSDEESYCFRDMIMSIWSLLEYLLSQKVRQDQLPGKLVKATLQDTLFGFEFKAIVEERSPIRQKQCTLKKSNGGWVDLVQDIDALVLFASGFGDLICPQEAEKDWKLCHRWRTAPTSKDYLVTCVRVLLDLFNVAGHRLDRKYLTSTRLQWHRGTSRLFEPCPTPKIFQCQCDRLQQIVAERAVGTVTAPGKLEEDGAVIFGASSSPFSFALPVRMDQTKNGRANRFYSQTNQVFCSPEGESSQTMTMASTKGNLSECETKIDFL